MMTRGNAANWGSFSGGTLTSGLNVPDIRYNLPPFSGNPSGGWQQSTGTIRLSGLTPSCSLAFVAHTRPSLGACPVPPGGHVNAGSIVNGTARSMAGYASYVDVGSQENWIYRGYHIEYINGSLPSCASASSRGINAPPFAIWEPDTHNGVQIIPPLGINPNGSGIDEINTRQRIGNFMGGYPRTLCADDQRRVTFLIQPRAGTLTINVKRSAETLAELPAGNYVYTIAPLGNLSFQTQSSQRTVQLAAQATDGSVRIGNLPADTNTHDSALVPGWYSVTRTTTPAGPARLAVQAAPTPPPSPHTRPSNVPASNPTDVQWVFVPPGGTASVTFNYGLLASCPDDWTVGHPSNPPCSGNTTGWTQHPNFPDDPLCRRPNCGTSTGSSCSPHAWIRCNESQTFVERADKPSPEPGGSWDRTVTLTNTGCDEFWSASWSGSGRIGWRHEILARNPSGVDGNWSTNRINQISSTGMGVAACNSGNTSGYCATQHYEWSRSSPWLAFNTQLNNANNDSTTLTLLFNQLSQGAQNSINIAANENPPNYAINATNQRGLQEGALFDFRTQDRWQTTTWSNISRWRERRQQTERCTERFTHTWSEWVEPSGCDEEGMNCTTPGYSIPRSISWDEHWVQWQSPPMWDVWTIRPTPVFTTAPTMNSWVDVEWRSLISSRCNATGIASASGTRQANPGTVSNNFFGVVLSPTRTTQSGPYSSYTSSFFDSIESCRNQIRCVNDVDSTNTTAARQNLGNTHATQYPGDINRWGANFAIWNPTQRNFSSNQLLFARDNQWHTFWIDHWRPRMEAGNPSTSWWWLQASGSTTNAETVNLSTQLPHTTQIRFRSDGTPGVAASAGGFTFQSQPNFNTTAWQLLSGDICNDMNSCSWNTLNNPLTTPQSLSGERTQFRARASWASRLNNPHFTQTQYIYNASIRTWSPTMLVGGSSGNRASVSNQNITDINAAFNNFDVWCRSTYNTNEPQQVVARWHRIWRTDSDTSQRTENRQPVIGSGQSDASSRGRVNFGDTTGSWVAIGQGANSERQLRISFLRPAGE
ncbi:MAG: hypothetical protein LBD23_16200 [Oscillospiraceae bacterium]|nr:hypothetical protein [Oscillospiraceae bacterium]